MLVDLRSQWSARQAPSDTSFGRRLVAASVVASWVVVASTPLFAPVSVQQDIGIPIARDRKPQDVVWQWPQPDWASQRSTINANLPAAPKDVFNWPSTEHTIGIWPQPEWPTQRAPFNSQFPQPPPVPSYPDIQSILTTWIPPAPLPLWVQVSAQQGPVPPPPPPQIFNWPNYNSINSWPQPDWPSQTTRKVPLNVLTPPPPNTPPVDIYAAWITVASQPLWTSVLAQNTPPSGPINNPPTAYDFSPIYATWATKTVTPLWNKYGYRDGPTVIPSNPPPVVQTDLLYAIAASWIPGDPEAVWGSSTADIIVSPPTTPFHSSDDRVHAAWIAPDPERVARRFTAPQPPPPDTPPFDARHPNVAVVLQTWDAYTALLTPPAHVIVRVQAAPIIFRRTLSSLGTRIRSRQTHGWS